MNDMTTTAAPSKPCASENVKLLAAKLRTAAGALREVESALVILSPELSRFALQAEKLADEYEKTAQGLEETSACGPSNDRSRVGVEVGNG